jgi:hypothetical protein
MKYVPKYAHIIIETNNEALKKTQIQAQTLRIKNEIKFLYKEKQLNAQLYHNHINNINTWQKICINIE